MAGRSSPLGSLGRSVAIAATFYTLGVVTSSRVPMVPKLGDSHTVAKSIDARFSPKGGCTERVVEELGKAKRSVFMQAYSFTSQPIAEALVAAARRGVEVQVILDKSQRSEKYTSADFVAHSRIPTYIDAKHAIAHNKIMIIDGEVVITGSFNFTKAAEGSNAENLLVINDPKLAGIYLDNWKAHKGHSEIYDGR